LDAYDAPPDSRELRQGEVLGPIWDHQSQELPILIEEGQPITSSPIEHRRLLVLTNDCDLLWDFQERFTDDESRRRMAPETESTSPYIIPGVVLCEMFEKAEIYGLGMKAATWKQATKNNHARYHYFEQAFISGPGMDDVRSSRPQPGSPLDRLIRGVLP
jgi:hypothetical protein